MATTHTLRKPVESLQALRRRKQLLVLGILLAAGLAGVLGIMLIGCGGGASVTIVPPPIATVQPLQTADVQNIVQAAVNSMNVDMVVAVVDRAGFVLGVFNTECSCNGNRKFWANAGR
jgi:flagellar biosynthesis/type III secretory pathway M-ring protein FliF/YscJ